MLKTEVKQLTPFKRKLRKLQRRPVKFFLDSGAYRKARRGFSIVSAKTGAFSLVIVSLILLTAYYFSIASSRYVGSAQFIIKQSNNDVTQIGFTAFTPATTSSKDAYMLKNYILSGDMALHLDKMHQLKAHYADVKWDYFSRLKSDSSKEEFIQFYKNHITVNFDELSETLFFEVQSFDKVLSLQLAKEILKQSEIFINELSKKIVKDELTFAQSEVKRAHEQLSVKNKILIDYQDKHKLFSPEQQSGTLLESVNKLEANIIEKQVALKSLMAYMRESSAEVAAVKFELESLKAEKKQVMAKLADKNGNAWNKINAEYQQLALNKALAADLYKTALASLETTRSETFKKLKHLLIVEYPTLAEDEKYPRRIYKISAWLLSILLVYFIGRLVVAIIKEHQE